MRNLSVGLVLWLWACGGTSEEEFERSRVRKEAEAFQQAEGVYEGQLMDPSTGAILAEAHLKLEAETKVDTSSSFAARQRLVLAGQFQIISDDLTSVALSEGFFNPESKEVDIPFQLNREDGSVVDFKLSGFLKDSALQGQVYAIGYSERAAVFHLTRSPDRSNLRSVVQEVNTLPESLVGQWTTQTENGRISISFYQSLANSQERLIELFVPIHLFDVVVDFYDTVQVAFRLARHDTRTGITTANYEVDATRGDTLIRLECSGFVSQNELECRYRNQGTGIVRQWQLKSDE